MTVTLIGMADSEKRVLEKLPAMISGESSSVETLAGTCRCLIAEMDDHLIVWDLGAKGGTFVNDVPVTKAVLHANDTLRLGGRNFSVQYDRGPRRYVHGVRC